MLMGRLEIFTLLVLFTPAAYVTKEFDEFLKCGRLQYGVFAPNSKHRVQVTPAKRGKVKKPRSLDENQTPAERRAAMTWPLPHIHVPAALVRPCTSLLVFDHRDVGGRAMPGAIAEKTRR